MTDLSERELNHIYNASQFDEDKLINYATRLADEVKRRRSIQTADTELVGRIVSSAFCDAMEVLDWRFTVLHREQLVKTITDLVSERLAGAAPITDLRLCEAGYLVLHPNQLYRFTAAQGCAKCEEISRDGLAAPIPWIPSVGDKVVRARKTATDTERGTVVRTQQAAWPYVVHWDAGHEASYRADELAPVSWQRHAYARNRRSASCRSSSG